MSASPVWVGPKAPHNMWLDLAVSSGLVALVGAMLSTVAAGLSSVSLQQSFSAACTRRARRHGGGRHT